MFDVCALRIRKVLRCFAETETWTGFSFLSNSFPILGGARHAVSSSSLCEFFWLCMTDNLHEALASITASYQIKLIEVCEVGMRSFPVEMKRFLANYIYRLELQLPDWWKRRCHSDKNKRHNIAVTHWNPNYANYIWIFHPLFSALRHCCLTGRTRNPFVSLEIRYSVTEWKTRVTSAVHAKLCCGRKLGNHIAKGKPIHFLDFSDEVPACFSVFVRAVVGDSKSNEFQETAGSSGINFLAI